METLKRKLSSRKFWVMVISVLYLVIVQNDPHAALNVVLAWLAAEGVGDALGRARGAGS
jgi:hypothetical protein